MINSMPGEKIKTLPRRKPNLEKLKYSRKNNSPKKESETFSLQLGFLR